MPSEAKRDDGGPAFPVVAANGLGHVADGMKLRDWFTKQAPEVPDWFMEDEATYEEKAPDDEQSETWGDMISRLMKFEKRRNEFLFRRMIAWRWHFADAMLSERSKP